MASEVKDIIELLENNKITFEVIAPR
jgi:hypothetical protein